jgi:RimJ/RimL family protein N-acetyltransferase
MYEHALETMVCASECVTDAASDPMWQLARRMRRRDPPTELRQLSWETAEQASAWMVEPSTEKWLDFGGERQSLTAKALFFMSQSPAHVIRTAHGHDHRMYAVLGLFGISRKFGTAMLWGVRPRLRPPVRANGAMELRQIMEIGFSELGLASVFSNIVDINKASLAVTAEAGLKIVGRRRAAHVVDGRQHDRIIFDIVAGEYFEQKRRLNRYLDTQREEEPCLLAQ